MKIEQKYINYKGKGNHSVSELENIIEQREEELHLIKAKTTVEECHVCGELTEPSPVLCHNCVY